MIQVTMKIHLAVPFTLLGYRNSDITRYLTLLSDCVYDVLKFTLSCFQVQLWIEMPGEILNEVYLVYPLLTNGNPSFGLFKDRNDRFPYACTYFN